MTMADRASLELRVSVRLVVAVLVGAVAAAIFGYGIGRPLVDALLLGYVVAALVFSVPLLWTMMRVGPEETRRYLDGMDPTPSETDIVVIVSSVASLAGIAVMLTGGAHGASSSRQIGEAALAVGTVACGWLLLHTIYLLRYARQWYNAEPGCIDFNGDDTPAFTDFAYLAFTLGMTYQVSDTDLKTRAVRRIVLRHTLLSYLFGTVIVASTINLVIGLAT